MFRLIARSFNKEFDGAGIYKDTEKNQYFTNSIHADRFGNISIKYKNKYYDIEIYQVRRKIKELFGITINSNSKIKIPICFPKIVKEKHHDQLYVHNLEIIGFWKTITRSQPIKDKETGLRVFDIWNEENPQEIIELGR